jgi:hypothetical protein
MTSVVREGWWWWLILVEQNLLILSIKLSWYKKLFLVLVLVVTIFIIGWMNLKFITFFLLLTSVYLFLVVAAQFEREKKKHQFDLFVFLFFSK